MKSYKEFRRNCPSGYKFSSKLGACIPKGNRHVNVVGRYLGGIELCQLLLYPLIAVGNSVSQSVSFRLTRRVIAFFIFCMAASNVPIPWRSSFGFTM